MSITEQIRVQGLVQGVGFRPTVFRLAQALNINGEVYNDGKGVLIILQADKAVIQRFLQQLLSQCPPLARIDRIKRKQLKAKQRYEDFSIRHSHNSDIHTGIVADAATCPECLNDINSDSNRRHGYAFTNCTHCGPRLSIIKNIPYDRVNTSMAEFELCPACRQEYEDPANRRFHAQPNACPDCGPVLSLTDNLGKPVHCDNEISKTAQLVSRGYIVAIKGIGGFQLACDATREQTVINLRQRKHRPHKALALMAGSVEQVTDYCLVSDAEQEGLESPAAPIVILRQKPDGLSLSSHIAPGQNSLGFMLPYSPLHHLLMQQLDRPIVLTSGNIAEAPQCIDNQQAISHLGQVADFFLMHNRDIVNRVDDSVLRWVSNRKQIYRRARGFAPAPILLPDGLGGGTAILACGGELKNTFCLLRDGQATLSQHMGNLENTQTFSDYLKNLDLYQRLFQFAPAAIVVDKHPEYLSTKMGIQLAREKNLPLVEVQHHHAHVAACLAENLWSPNQGPVLGVVFDGLGWGDDGTIWGGEFLLADYQNFTRLGRFKPVAMPGATQAILEPWRNCYAQLHTHCDWNELLHNYPQLELFDYLQQKPLETLNRMMNRHINSPLTSSCGRLFDAVAAAVGLCRDRISYEGQAAIELEALINSQVIADNNAYPFELEHNALLEINPAPMWHALLHDLHNKTGLSTISARFHRCVAEMIMKTIERLSAERGLKTVALSGGVFQNPTLLQLTVDQLQKNHFSVLIHQQIPSNDGGLALGQAAIASVRLLAEPADGFRCAGPVK